jgi:hypothetical protein
VCLESAQRRAANERFVNCFSVRSPLDRLCAGGRNEEREHPPAGQCSQHRRSVPLQRGERLRSCCPEGSYGFGQAVTARTRAKADESVVLAARPTRTTRTRSPRMCSSAASRPNLPTRSGSAPSRRSPRAKAGSISRCRSTYVRGAPPVGPPPSRLRHFCCARTTRARTVRI